MSAKLHKFLLLLLAFSLALPSAFVRAQGTATIVLFQPDSGKFPTITAFLDVFDEQGEFVTGLTASELSVLENGQNIGTPSTFEIGRASCRGRV